MIEYIYIVKCPGCEDEMFNFFTDARMQCDLLMSKKPYITQVEVERNDFGECTDSHDLGTVWSWEEAMKDTEDGYTEAEPAKTLFTKDDLKLMANGQDPEFDNLDNSVDCEVEEPETSEVSPVERKPIPEGMTIEQLVEEMEENEDTVECTQCNELFDKSTCRKELNLGWCCSRCADDLIARGEGPVFKSDNYWDFLDEDLEELSFSEMVVDSINHLINDLGKDSSAEDFVDDVIKDIENNYDTEVPEDPEKYRDWASAVAGEVSRQLNNSDNLTEASLSNILSNANSELGTSYDESGLLSSEQVEDEDFFDDLETYPELQAERKQIGKENAIKARAANKLEELEPETVHDLGNEYDGGYPDEPSEVSDSHLKLCPECGKESFDIETGICVDCGFN